MPDEKETRNRTSANGEGSCRYIESKKLWCARITIGWEVVNGKKKQIRPAFYGKKKQEALDQATEAKARALHGGAAISSNTKISAWADKWIRTYVSGLSPRTVKSYTGVVDNHIKPAIGSLTMKEIKPSDIKLMITNLVKQGKSKSLVSRVKILSNAMFEAAEDDNLVIKNPCRKIKLPPMQGSKEKIPFSKEEIKAIYDFAPNYLTLDKPHVPHRIGAIIKILLKTGLRQEELLALQWKHIDLKENVIKVRQAVTVKDGKPILKDPKSFDSRRDIPIHKEVADILLERMPTGNDISELFVFPTEKGGIWIPRNFQRDYKYFFEKAQEAGYNVQYRSPHICRHTFATYLRAKGVDAKTISRLLGHAKVDISYEVYIHTDAKSERDAIDRL